LNNGDDNTANNDNDNDAGRNVNGDSNRSESENRAEHKLSKIKSIEFTFVTKTYSRIK